jgi:hypothetical protein
VVANTIRSLSGPAQSLNKEERVALAGEAYRSFVADHKHEPGDAEEWDTFSFLLQRASDAPDAGEEPTDVVPNVCDLTRFSAGLTEAVLRKKGLAVDDRSRGLLVEEVHLTLQLASRRIKAYADSDYSPDANLSRFPAWPGRQQQLRSSDASPAASTGGIVTLSDLLEAWSRKKKRPRITTVDAYRSSVQLFKQHLGH